MGKRGDAYRVLVMPAEVKRQLGRVRHRWEYNVKLSLKETGSDGTDWG